MHSVKQVGMLGGHAGWACWVGMLGGHCWVGMLGGHAGWACWVGTDLDNATAPCLNGGLALSVCTQSRNGA